MNATSLASLLEAPSLPAGATQPQSTSDAARPAAENDYPDLAIGAATVAACVVYAAVMLDQGWIPHDEGQLGLTAQRILAGELPHRDFVEPYTGGLGYYHAAACWWLGANSIVLRLSLLPFFALFCAATFWMARRVAPAATAVLVTMLAAALTLPVYPAAMPSWYNLFLAVCGAAALLKYNESEDRRWLFVAGVCGGMSIACKIVGVYFVAAALAFLLYRSGDEPGLPGLQRGWRTWLLCGMLAACAATGLLLVRNESLALDLAHFFVPISCVAVVVIVHEWQSGSVDGWARLSRLSTEWGLLTAGVVVPLAILAGPYVWAGACGDLVYGVFVLPLRRLDGAAKPFAGSWLLLLPAALLASVVLLGWLQDKWSRRATFVLTGILCAQFATSMLVDRQLVLYAAIRHVLPLLVIAATAGCLLRAGTGERGTSRARAELFLLLTATAFVSLVQYPYSGDFYFFYAAPLGVLLALYTIRVEPRPPVFLGHLALCMVLILVVVKLNLPNPALGGGIAVPVAAARRMQLERSPLIVRTDQARLYEDLIATVRQRSPEGGFIYAGPDCPEVYFLADRRNPTRSSYSLFDARAEDEARSLLAKIEQHDVKVVVLNLRSEFSDQLPAGVEEAVSRSFDHRKEFRAKIGAREQAFTLYWRK